MFEGEMTVYPAWLKWQMKSWFDSGTAAVLLSKGRHPAVLDEGLRLSV